MGRLSFLMGEIMQKFTMEMVMELDDRLEHAGILLAKDSDGDIHNISAKDVLKVSEILNEVLKNECE